MELSALYSARFSEAERKRKARLWRTLWSAVFAEWVQPNDTLLDLGAGYLSAPVRSHRPAGNHLSWSVRDGRMKPAHLRRLNTTPLEHGLR
jgi:hypothetical protein